MLLGCKPVRLVPGRAGGGSSYFRAVVEVSVGEDDNLGGGAGKASAGCWCCLSNH